MSLRDLAPKNTTKAKATAVNVFKRFLATEDVSLDYIHACLSSDTSGRLIEGIMDKFGLYLAFDAGRAGAPLARNTVAGYFRHVKLWLLDEYPQCRHLVEKQLLNMANTLEKHCMKREAGSYIKKAEACTKQHLKAMAKYLYSTASQANDYQDLALLSLMWYLFGRASDLSMLRKPNVALSSDASLFIKLIRVKTSEEQGLTVFPDQDFLTCPITSLTVALATQTVPDFALLSQLPVIAPTTITELGPGTSLRDIIEADGHMTTSVSREGPQAKGNSPGIHNYVNRLLDRITAPSGVKVQLSSHSFRRGGAQHANGSAELSPQWIFDRGAWNMTSTNKAFAYVFNTTSEDQKVAKYLSGWKPAAGVKLLTLDVFDSSTRTIIDAFRDGIFASCCDLRDPRYNISQPTLNTLTAYLVRAYPRIKELQRDSPLSGRVERTLEAIGATTAELLRWSVHLEEQETTLEQPAPDLKHLEHQAAIVNQLIEHNQRLAERLRVVEAQLALAATSTEATQPTTLTVTKRKQEDEEASQPKKRARSSQTSLLDAWYHWYVGRAFESPTLSRQKKSELRQTIGYMRLFAGAYELREGEPSYRDRVLETGSAVNAAVVAYFTSLGIGSRSSGTALKAWRLLHRQGSLNEHIGRYEQLRDAGRIVDTTPNICLEVVETK